MKVGTGGIREGIGTGSGSLSFASLNSLVSIVIFSFGGILVSGTEIPFWCWTRDS